MSRTRKLGKDEIRTRRADISARARAGKLTFPSAMLEIRNALSLTQEEFAKTFRLTLRQVREIERGEANPTVETLNRVAKVFGFSLGFVPRQDEAKTIKERAGHADIPAALATLDRVQDVPPDAGDEITQETDLPGSTLQR